MKNMPLLLVRDKVMHLLDSMSFLEPLTTNVFNAIWHILAPLTKTYQVLLIEDDFVKKRTSHTAPAKKSKYTVGSMHINSYIDVLYAISCLLDRVVTGRHSTKIILMREGALTTRLKSTSGYHFVKLHKSNNTISG